MCSIILNVMICIAEALERLLKRDLGRERLAHSRRVADLAAELCLAYGLAGEKGRLAGLAHDWARDGDGDACQDRVCGGFPRTGTGIFV